MALLTTGASRAILRALCDRAAEAEDTRIIPTERWAATFRSAAQLILPALASFYGYPPPGLGKFPVSGSDSTSLTIRPDHRHEQRAVGRFSRLIEDGRIVHPVLVQHLLD